MSRKLTVEEFISRAKATHGDKYDYSKVEYVGVDTKVCIICPIHGEFWQTPYKHINRQQGCPICSGNVKLLFEDFVSRAKVVHGDKYDYSKVNYINAHAGVCIICPIHGEFWQTANAHIRGAGCPKCKGGVKISKEEFVSRAKIVHGDKYDYSKVEYINSTQKVKIFCNSCKAYFYQTPSNHISGAGCPACSHEGPSKGELQIMKYLNDHKVSYIFQKRFETCKDKKPLPFDFYLPDYNLCIEYQGKQHFEITDKFGGEEGFNILMTHDKIKKDWCLKEENPNLIEITYLQNIEEILEHEL